MRFQFQAIAGHLFPHKYEELFRQRLYQMYQIVEMCLVSA